MTNNSKKKIISVCLVVALMATLVIGATLAYFQDDDTTVNTFTIGDQIKVTLDETSEDFTPPEGYPETVVTGTEKNPEKDPDKEDGFTYEQVIPNTTYAKQLTLSLTGQDAYMFVEFVVDNISGIKDAIDKADLDAAQKEHLDQVFLVGKNADYIKDSNLVAGWTDTDGAFHVVYGFGKCTPTDVTGVRLFDGVQVPKEFTNDSMEVLGDSLDFEITAYAIQADNLTEKTDEKDKEKVAFTELFPGKEEYYFDRGTKS